MRSPKDIKEVLQLTGRPAALVFLIKSSNESTNQVYQPLKRNKDCVWDEESDSAFQALKQYSSSPPMLESPSDEETLLLHLSMGETAFSSVLVKNFTGTKTPTYFVSKTLQGPELRYFEVEKFFIRLIISTKRLRQHFQSHRIIVGIAQPIKQILQKPDLAERMTA